MLKAPRHHQASTGGFTLTELMVAASLGVGLSIVSGQALLSHFSSSERAESLVRQRSHWSRTVQFIEAEVALSERSITNPDNINIPTACAAGSNPEEWFRVALEIRRDLPLVIYGVSPVTDNSAVGSHMLWRCGPGILASGQYDGGDYSSAMVIDGLDGACGLKILADDNNDCRADDGATSKSLNFELALKGLATRSYSLAAGTQSRISPVFSFPDTTLLCNAANISKANVATGSSENKSNWTSDVVICGKGSNTMIGSSNDDVIESAGGSATADGGDGHDRLVGSNGDDTLSGGLGNDTLIGKEGSNTLRGCSTAEADCASDGENHYLSGLGSDTIYGAGGLDVVFFPGSKDDYSFNLEDCSTDECTVSLKDSSPSSTIYDAEILIFTDARIDLD